MKTWKVQVTEEYQQKFITVLEYIAQDKPKAASNFRKESLSKIKKLSTLPYKNRKSIYFENEEIRDLIFKGYTFIYEIRDKEIIVFSLLKHQLEP